MLSELWPALEKLPWAQAVREGAYLFPTLESVHVVAITLVVGTILIVDLRLLGVASHDKALRRLTDEVLPYTWAFFGLAALSGGLLFISRATVYAQAVPFQLKFVCMALAGLNMLAFHFRAPSPAGEKISGAASLILWLSIVVFGRWTGFVML